MDRPRTAVVTGSGKRVGAEISRALIAEGWTVIAHVRSADDPVEPGSIKVSADLADRDCASSIFDAAAQFPPVRLLVNNAARFAPDAFGAARADEFDAHMAVNVRAPLLLIEAFAAAHDGATDALVVNLLDAKMAAPNPDFLSYTWSKYALAGLTELAARAFAHRGIRVNGIAPALMLRSAGQSEGNFARMQTANPLRRALSPTDVIAALKYLIASPAVTGEVLTIDGGQRFWSLERDVQFLEKP
jgi:NAD(P)-dependent dehydrogenase (short-subunit alcohol dehydrogenase family)